MWSNVGKPSVHSWTNKTFTGFQTFDDSSVTYDDPSAFYDSMNMNAWTNIAKPAAGVMFTIPAGTATGLICPPTYATSHSMNMNTWTNVPKPS